METCHRRETKYQYEPGNEHNRAPFRAHNDLYFYSSGTTHIHQHYQLQGIMTSDSAHTVCLECLSLKNDQGSCIINTVSLPDSPIATVPWRAVVTHRVSFSFINGRKDLSTDCNVFPSAAVFDAQGSTAIIIIMKIFIYIQETPTFCTYSTLKRIKLQLKSSSITSVSHSLKSFFTHL